MSKEYPLALTFVVFAVVFCCLGFVRLEQKPYWMDEVVTSEHITPIFSLAAVPALYWCALELFQSQLIAAISVWLYALSPFELIYAQQAGEYSMWILLTLLSFASLICATRRPRLRPWLLYFSFISTMLWTHLLSIWIVIAQAAFMSVHSPRNSKTLIAFSSAGALALLLLTPWLITIVTRPAELNDYGGPEKQVAPSLYAETFLLNLSRTVLDVGWPSYEHLPYFQWRLIVPIAATVVLIASCLWLFMRTATSELRTLLGLLGISTMLPLMLADVVAGGRRALLPRYDSPAWISLDLILAWLIPASTISFGRQNTDALSWLVKSQNAVSNLFDRWLPNIEPK